MPWRKPPVSEESARPDEAGGEPANDETAGEEPASGDDSSTEDNPDVRVVDRRWWARSDDSDNGQAGQSNKPSYIENLERELADKDRLLQDYAAKYRTAAKDFDATRARLRKEVAKDVDREKRTVLASFLEVADNLDRAIEASREASADNPEALNVLHGVEMVRQQLLATLRTYGVAPIDAAGQPFDPNQHDAISTVPVADQAQEDVVIEVIKPGYSINEDVLRPATVTVGKVAPKSE